MDLIATEVERTKPDQSLALVPSIPHKGPFGHLLLISGEHNNHFRCIVFMTCNSGSCCLLPVWNGQERNDFSMKWGPWDQEVRYSGYAGATFRPSTSPPVFAIKHYIISVPKKGGAKVKSIVLSIFMSDNYCFAACLWRYWSRDRLTGNYISEKIKLIPMHGNLNFITIEQISIL